MICSRWKRRFTTLLTTTSSSWMRFRLRVSPSILFLFHRPFHCPPLLDHFLVVATTQHMKHPLDHPAPFARTHSWTTTTQPGVQASLTQFSTSASCLRPPCLYSILTSPTSTPLRCLGVFTNCWDGLIKSQWTLVTSRGSR